MSSEAEQAKTQIAGVFDRAAITYDRVGPRFFAHFGRRLVDYARIPAGAAVLDVATGRGAVLFPAAESAGPSGHVTGIDLAESMVRETTGELQARHIQNAQVLLMDAERIEFADESFDIVTCGFAIFFMPQVHRALAEFRRVLKPGGYLAVTTWGKATDHTWDWFNSLVHDYFPDEPPANDQAEPPTPRPVFNQPEGMQDLMQSTGFENIQTLLESAEFVYADEHQWWNTQWSHGARETLEEIEKRHGPAGLAKFQEDVFARLQAMKQADGIHSLLNVILTLARKPGQ